MGQKNPLLFLSCNTPWVTALAREMAVTRPVIAVGNSVFGMKSEGQRVDEDHISSNQFEWIEWKFPPGYVGSFSKLFSTLVARRVRILCSRMKSLTGISPYVIAPYPYNHSWLTLVPECRVIYYNLDDYSLYEPLKARNVAVLEARLLERSSLVLCLAKTQAEKFSAISSAPGKVVHFPLGVMERFIRPEGMETVEPNSIVYVGGMEDRVDWRYVARVASLCSNLTFYFVGHVTPESNPPLAWQSERATALALQNVVAVGRVPQGDICDWSWKAAVNWMPYKANHPFNIACCPTKIMDYMASGRPILSTSVPECALYPEWITVRDNAVDAAEWLNTRGGNDKLTCNNLQIEFALQNTWCARANILEKQLSKFDDPQIE